MVKIIILIGAFLLGFWGSIIYISVTVPTVIPASSEMNSERDSRGTVLFKIRAPSNALIGLVEDVAGTARIEKRGSNGPVNVSLNEDVLYGEALSTGINSQVVVRFNNGHIISLKSGSRVSFLNTQESSFLVSQTTGAVAYKSEKPLSVHTGVVLTTIQGEVLLEYFNDADILGFNTKNGTAVMSWLNNDNETEVYKIPSNTSGELDITNDKVSLEE